MVNSRKELIGWFNSLGIEINKIEELGKGTAICKLLSQIHPSFPTTYIQTPTNEYEFLKNMKLIQGFLIQNKIEMYFPVDKLIKCKLQDNLEVAQKLYKHWVNINTKGDKIEVPVSNPRKVVCKVEEPIQETGNPPDSNLISIDRSLSRKTIIENINQTKGKLKIEEEKRIEELEKENEKLKNEILEKNQEILKFKNVIGELGSVKDVLKALEGNRDFYFEKLVEIEKCLVESSEVPENIKGLFFEILYRKQE